jgi:type IV pilus biogenesis protein PilP
MGKGVTPAPSPMQAPAAPQIPRGDGPSLQEFTSAQSRLLLLDKQIEAAKLALRLAKAQNTLHDLQAQEATYASTKPGSKGLLFIGPNDPRVLSIQGGPATGISADVKLPEGLVLHIKPGDLMPDGWAVAFIKADKVILSRAGQPDRILPVLTKPSDTDHFLSSDLSEHVAPAQGLPAMPPVPPMAAGDRANTPGLPAGAPTNIPVAPSVAAGQGAR